jgi:pimeloyl-ACP methyl ester carboxylesterase
VSQAKKISLLSDVRGASRLVIDLTLLVTELVETMHHNVARRPGIVGRATFEPTKGVTGLVYRSVRGITRMVGGGIDAVLAPLVPVLAGKARSPRREAVVAALNGVLGDQLFARNNPLAIAMQIRVNGRPLEPTAAGIRASVPRPRNRVIVMVHGLCMNDLQWNRESHDHGRALARDLDANALYLHYNSGRHVSTSGTELASLLEQLVAQWPVPLREIVLVGHSMGGLVTRSAFAVAQKHGLSWPGLVRALVFLGAPHHGASLERGGHGVDMLLAASPYTAAFTRLGRLRSAGITDLRHGSVRDEDWQQRDRFAHGCDMRRPQPLPRNAPCFAIAGSLSKAAPDRGRAPRGDGLVSVASALGRHEDARRDLRFKLARQRIAYGTGHLDLLSSKDVHQQMKRWLVDVC